jgi:hypothetical protein
MKFIGVFLLALLFAGAYGQAAFDDTPIKIYNPADNGWKEAVEIIGGILIGSFEESSSIKTCFDDAQSMFYDFQNAYTQLKRGKHANVEDGIVHIGRALLKFPNAMKDCKFTTDIITKIESLSVRFSNPTLLVVTVGKNILWHSVSIYKEVRAMISAYEDEKWFNFGLEIGRIVDLVFLRNPFYKQNEVERNLGNTGTEFLDGFAHGVSPGTYSDVVQCIHEVSSDTFSRIKKDVKDINWKHLERSIKDIQDIGEIFVGILKDCKTGSKSVQALALKLGEAFTTAGFIKAAIKIAGHPMKFEKMVSKIHSDFKKNHYFAAGEDIGEFVGVALSIRASIIDMLLQ